MNYYTPMHYNIINTGVVNCIQNMNNLKKFATSESVLSFQKSIHILNTIKFQNSVKSTDVFYTKTLCEAVNHLIFASKTLNSLPAQTMREVVNTVKQNTSILRDIAKSNSELNSSLNKLISESDIKPTITISEYIAEIIGVIDDKIKFPKPDTDKQIHIQKSNSHFPAILKCLFTIVTFLVGIYQNEATTNLIIKNHFEQMEEGHKQTMELKKQTKELQRNNELLEKLINSGNAATPAGISPTQHTN